MRKLLRKVVRKAYDFSEFLEMMMCSECLPKTEDALIYLQQVAPNPDGSCWIERDSNYENRSLKLSVIVPAYNVEQYISKCLDSILDQQLSFDYEVIVINDGSTDATAQRLEEYVHNEKIRILHQENKGLSGARNAGIACSKGEYLFFVDSDDDIPSGSLECIMRAALQNNSKLVAGSYEKCLRSGEVQYVKRLVEQKTDGPLPGFAWGKLIHYSVFRNIQFPEGYWFEDSVMAQIVHPICWDSMYTISSVCCRYYSNDTGITATAKGKMKSVDSLWVTMHLLEDREKYGLSYTGDSYAYFLSMVKLTYQRTKSLGVRVAQSIFVVQRMLLDRYYDGYQIRNDRRKQKIQEALRENNFRKYILACEKN